MITACDHSVQWQCAVQLLADMEEADWSSVHGLDDVIPSPLGVGNFMM